MIVLITTIVLLLLSHFVLGKPNCDKDFNNYIYRSFLHGDYNHLLVNVLSLWNLVNLERELETQKFITLMLFLIVASSGIHFIIDKITGTKRCAIGFSGVLFGMIIYQIGLKGFKTESLAEIGVLLLMPFASQTNVSHIGHLSGVIAGVLASLLISPQKKN